MGNKPATAVQPEISVAANGSVQDTCRFGLFEVDFRAGELRRQGIKVKLQEQPFQILAHLLEFPGEVVTREELRQRLWPVDTFVDFDHSLNAAIRRLRDALGDTAENPRYVETVARRGYRFLAPVGRSTAESGSLTIVKAEDVSPRASAHSKNWWIAGTTAALFLFVFGILLGVSIPRHGPAPMRVTQLTANPVGDPVQTAAISRDGRYLAYSDQDGFYLREIDTGETHPLALPAKFTAAAASWHPDSAHIVVNLRAPSGDLTLWELSAFGGEPRQIFDDGQLPSVSPDGKELAFVAGKPLRQRIWLANLDGSNRRELAGEDGDLFGSVTWAPDSSNIAYTTAKFGYAEGVHASVRLISSGGAHSVSQPTTLLSLPSLHGPLAWASDGRLIYSVGEARPRQMDSNLWSIQLNRESKPDGAAVRLTDSQGGVFGLAISEDGKRILYVKGLPQPDVYIAKIDSSGALREPQRLTLDDRQDMPYDWTVDGKQVIFASDRTGIFNVYKQAPGQTVPDLLVASTQESAVPRLSPDGTQLLYLSYPSWGDNEYETPLMRVPLTGGAPQTVARANWICNVQCSRVPGGACLYGVIRARKRDLTFFKFDPMRGNPSQVYQIKDDMPQLYNWSLSPDGTTLAIARGKWGDQENRIHLVPLNGAPDRWLPVTGWPGVASLDWAADSKSIWVATPGDRDNPLLNVNLQGTVRVAWRPQRLSVQWAIPSRDGKSLALHVNSTSANVWMLERP